MWVWYSSLPSSSRETGRNPSQLRALADRANLQLVAVLLEDVLVVVLPEGLGGVLAREALQDLCAARVLLEELCVASRGQLRVA